jgi:hypothetical protein
MTSHAGQHAHTYKDIFFSESHGYHDTVGTPNGFGTSTRTDNDNAGLQMTRTTYDSGNHDHSINGHSGASSASITNTGNNEKHENRPPYYVVAYIVFIDLV